MSDHRMSRRAAITRIAGIGIAGGGAAGLSFSSASAVITAEALPFNKVQLIPGGARLKQGTQCIDILCAADGAVSVVKYPATGAYDTVGFFLTPERLSVDIRFSGNTLYHGEIEVRIDTKAGRFAVWHHGKPIICDTGTTLDTCLELIRASDLYGLGQFRDPLANYRDRTLYLAQANMDAVNPLVVSPDGFGVLWDTGTDAHMTSAGVNLIFSHHAPVIRYHILLGEGLDGVVASYRRLTGKAPLLGKHAYGFWQSQERYRTQDELTGILDGYRTRQLPIDVMVQDWRYWGEDAFFSGMVWDKASFPDPKGMCDHVHGQNAHVIASVWPAFGPLSDIYKALDAKNLLFSGPHWSGGKVLDITSPEARDIYWSHIRDGLLSVGLDGLWTDGCEPEFMSTGSRYVTARSYAENGDCAAGPIRDHLMTFSYYQTRLIHGSAVKDKPEKRPLILSRSVYAGQQAFNAITWSGDQFAAWQTLRYQVSAAQQFSLSGIPYWTDDIGGFLVSHRFPGGWGNPAYCELYVRWFQFGAFMPVFRAHGTEIPRQVWAIGNDGDSAYEALKIALKRRYSLMPYIYAQAARVSFGDETFLRPLVMDFAQDPNITNLASHYMFGHDILVRVVDTPLQETQGNLYEFIPNYAVTGLDGPAPEVTFYEGAHFDRLVDTRRSDDLKMSWSGDIPYALKGKPYSARWKGRIIAQESGLHNFSIMTQGLISFSLDGVTQVASKGTDDGKATEANGGVSFAGHQGDDSYRFDKVLKAGQAYEFELTQSQPIADIVSLWVEWSPPSRRADLQVSPDKMIEVYLPAGANWHVFGKAGLLKGGQRLKLRPALSEMPLYVRAGAIIPQTPDIQYATQSTAQTELHIYGGADGSFTLYDDEGDGHAYQTGACRHWLLRWNDSANTLIFAPAEGQYGRDPVTFFIRLYLPDGALRETTVTISPDQTLSLAL